MQDYRRSSDCWRQTVPRPGGSDKKRSVTQWGPSSRWYDERWQTRYSQMLSGLHSSDLLKLVGQEDSARLRWHLNARTHSLYWILSWIRCQSSSFKLRVVWSAFIPWRTKQAALLWTAWMQFQSFAGRPTNSECRDGISFAAPCRHQWFTWKIMLIFS